MVKPRRDSELSRLLLRHYEVAYRESDHLFGWVSLLTFFHGGYGRVPLFYGGGARLTGPRRIAEHFEDGRLYLAGERLTLGDLALASASAPLLLPQGCGARMPALEEMPPVLRTAMEDLRQRPTASFVQRLHAEAMPAAKAAS